MWWKLERKILRFHLIINCVNFELDSYAIFVWMQTEKFCKIENGLFSLSICDLEINIQEKFICGPFLTQKVKRLMTISDGSNFMG